MTEGALKLLSAIGSTEPSTFREFLRELGDEAPEKGERASWRILFLQIEELEEGKLIEVERLGDSIDTLILTEAGAARVRAMR